MEGNPEELASLIFTVVKPPYSIQLDGGTLTTTKDIFEFYINILHRGFKYKFGDETGRVRMSQITPTQLANMDEAFHAIGMGFKVDPVTDTPQATHTHYEGTLGGCYLVIWDREQNIGYKITLYRYVQ